MNKLIVILTSINIILSALYYFIAIFYLKMPAPRLSYLIEVPVMFIANILPLYFVVNRYSINFLDNFDVIVRGGGSQSKGKGAAILGYVFSIFLLFRWIMGLVSLGG